MINMHTPHTMNHLLRPSLAFCSLALASACLAQVSIGNRAGLGFSRQISDDDALQTLLDKDQNTLIGFAAALPVEVMIHPNIGFQVEFALTQKGHQQNEPKQVGYYRQRLNYGEAALLAKGAIGKGPTKLNLLAGASFGRGLVGVQRTAATGIGTDSVSFLDQDSKLVDFGPGTDELARVEWSFIGGLGVSFDIGRSRIFLEGRYVYGLTSIYNPVKSGTELPGVFNRTTLFQVGYFVRLNDRKEKGVSSTPAGVPQY